MKLFKSNISFLNFSYLKTFKFQNKYFRIRNIWRPPIFNEAKRKKLKTRWHFSKLEIKNKRKRSNAFIRYVFFKACRLKKYKKTITFSDLILFTDLLFTSIKFLSVKYYNFFSSQLLATPGSAALSPSTTSSPSANEISSYTNPSALSTRFVRV